jgi:hypothetical protein
MAARRLLILLLAVLAISTLAAALIGPRPTRQSPPAPTTAGDPPRGQQARDRSGRLIEKTVEAGRRRAETIRLRSGDQLELTVRSRVAGQVEVPRLGLLEDVGPDVPAHLSLLPDELGHFPVRLAGSGQTVAVVVVSAAGGGVRSGAGRHRSGSR